MTAVPTPEAWAQIRYEYEHTDKPLDDICRDHRISASTLHERVRRWGWTPRRRRIPAEGPPPLRRPAEAAAPLVPAAAEEPTPHVVSSEAPPADPAEIVPRLQGAFARVLPAIEATVGRLAAGLMHPREMERAARALSSLTRTLRELNGLLSEHQARVMEDDGMPEDMDAFRENLARKIDALVASRQAAAASQPDDECVAPQET